MLEVASAVQYLHSEGVFYGDLNGVCSCAISNPDQSISSFIRTIFYLTLDSIARLLTLVYRDIVFVSPSAAIGTSSGDVKR